MIRWLELDNRPVELITRIRLETMDFIDCLLFFQTSFIPIKAMSYLIDLQHFVVVVVFS